MMNLIAKRINLIGILLLAGFATATAALYYNIPSRLKKDSPKPAAAVVGHSCAMHAQTSGEQPDQCSGHAAGVVAAGKMSGTHAGVEQAGGGCCASPQTSVSALPPGHPPVPGYNVPPGCGMSGGAAPNAVE